jgi:hypothetical protein
MDPVSALLLRYRPVPTASLHIANRRRSSWFLSDEEPKQLLPGRNLSFSVATVASLSTPRPTPAHMIATTNAALSLHATAAFRARKRPLYGIIGKRAKTEAI